MEPGINNAWQAAYTLAAILKYAVLNQSPQLTGRTEMKRPSTNSMSASRSRVMDRFLHDAQKFPCTNTASI